MMNDKILIVEDEEAISRVLKVYLQKHHFDVAQSFNGDDAIQIFDNFHPALVLLDMNLPGKDGWEILSWIREKSACPVIVLTALGEVNSRLNGFHAGADDYITKPFVAEEVVARVRAVLRRSTNLIQSNETIQYGCLKINLTAHTVTLNGVPLQFNPRDLALLLFLIEHPNQLFTRDQIIEQVWGLDFEGSNRAVDLAIKRIRRVLSNWPRAEGEIKTHRGLGYQLRVYEKK
ncbi:response regulator transcription factor [Hazenella sp. IB182353]|uniref:response regulator transcription factor n=1 Tax=Polycladospora coralii TaxID=2771432 RepID=UPI0017469891|nr:response regulator transcription factor [Polycladospora coralii]MBS7528895.1 response regulator transcription factor [Polycladospora coralii]